MSDQTSPRPWRCDHVSRRWVFDASGTEVASCILAEDAALLVAAVNERDELRANIGEANEYIDHLNEGIAMLEARRAALRDLVRRFADYVETYHSLGVQGRQLVQEARAAIAAPESLTSLAPTSPEAAP